MDKTGIAFADILPAIVTILVLGGIFILVSFTIPSQTAAEQAKIQERIAGIETKDFLIEYVHTPVTIDGKQSDMAQLITIWSYNPTDELEELIEQESERILSSFEGRPSSKRSAYSMTITASTGDIGVTSPNYLGTLGRFIGAYRARYEKDISLPTAGDPIKVELERVFDFQVTATLK